MPCIILQHFFHSVVFSEFLHANNEICSLYLLCSIPLIAMPYFIFHSAIDEHFNCFHFTIFFPNSISWNILVCFLVHTYVCFLRVYT